MPKSKRLHRKKSGSGGSGHLPHGGSGGKSVRRLNIAIALLAAVALGAAAVYWYLSRSAEGSFLTLVEQGQGALDQVVTYPSAGRRHLDPGESYAYAEKFPTSGPHAAYPTEPGFYERPQPPVNLVHALEHGSIVIYYDTPGEDAMASLKEWTDLYPAKWAGVVATPMAGLGESLVLNAWTKELRLARFDAAAAAAFIDAYRGRGPENPAR